MQKTIHPMKLVRPDLPRLTELFKDLETMWESGRVTNFGPFSEELEARCSRYIGCDVLACSSATTTLTATLLALDIPRGTTAVIPSFTFAATAQAVVAAGLSMRFCEVEEDGNLSPRHLERILAKESDIGVVIPVHLYGTPADVKSIETVVRSANKRRRKRVRTVYDAAHAFGARVGQQMIGTFGDAEVFSLSATKTLVACEGGLVASHSGRFLRRFKTARNYGLTRDNLVASIGVNGKMSEVHAAIALRNLDSYEQRLARRRAIAALLRRDIESRTSFACLPQRATDHPTYKDFTIRLDARTARRRASVMRRLADMGIETRVYFTPPLHRQRLFGGTAERLPVTDALSRTVLTIPFHTAMTDAESERLVSALREVSER